MCGRRLLTAAVVACVAMLVQTAPAPASVNDVASGRLSVVRLAVTPVDLAPPECAGLPLSTVVTAEPGSDGARIRGTRGADLILGSPGDDVLDGHAGDDCLVGGPGADDLDGGPGHDTCLPGGEPGDTTARCET